MNEAQGTDPESSSTANLANTLNQNLQLYEQYFSSISTLATSFGSLVESISARRVENIEREGQEQIKAIENSTLSEEEKAKEIEKINKNIEKETAQAEYKGALAAWRFNLLDSAARAALAVISAYNAPPVSWPITVPTAIAAGAAATTAVALQRPQSPQLATGGIVMPISGGVPTVQAENGFPELSLNGGPEGEALLNQFAERVASGGGNGGQTVNIYLNDVLTKSNVYPYSRDGIINISTQGVI